MKTRKSQNVITVLTHNLRWTTNNMEPYDTIDLLFPHLSDTSHSRLTIT